MSAKATNTIRSARETDAPAIAALLIELDWFEHLRHEPLAHIETHVSRHIGLYLGDDSHSLLVVQDASAEVVAYAGVHWLPYLFLKGPEGYISELFVRRKARGQGIGGALLAHIERLARERGCHRLMLINSRRRESYQRGFYVKHGWVEREGVANLVRDLGT